MRSTVLMVHPDESWRGYLSRSLAGRGYEVIPAATEEEGLRFAEALRPVVIVASAELAGFADGTILRGSSTEEGARTLILLGGALGGASAAADGIYSIPVADLEPPELARKVGAILLAREVGLSCDDAFEALVGDLALTPILELLQALHGARVSGVITLQQGWLSLDRGDVTAAASGAASAIKAFLRLAREAEGPVRLVLGTPNAEAEIQAGFEELIGEAIEASLGERLNPRMRVQVEVGPALFKKPFTNRQRRLLSIAHRTVTLEDLLDALPDPDHEIASELRILEAQGILSLAEPESRVQVITDSTCDLPREWLRRLGIRVVPLYVDFGEDAYLDGVDLEPREFYHLLETRPEPPSTRPPATEDFRAVYTEVARDRDILSLHISGAMSETANHARAAAQGLREGTAGGFSAERRLKVVDSRHVSLGLGLMAVFAARMARRGLEIGEIQRRLDGMPARIHAMLVVDSLDSLARGGRIGKAQAWVGGLLGIKPILVVEEGEIRPLARVRRLGPAQRRLVELLEARIDPERPLVAAVAHARAPLQADRVRGLLTERLAPRETIVSDMGPVVGVHVGPGTVAAAVYQPDEEEWPWIEPLR